MAVSVMSWADLENIGKNHSKPRDLVHGPASSQARLRLFGQPEESVRVTLYRDHHAWCPYCQKIWLFLEEKRVPYRIEKVTMFCYGEKEAWYKKICPSGMLPALQLDGKLVTESDFIIDALEKQFGPLHAPFSDPKVTKLRRLERNLFSAWCRWLCYPSRDAKDEEQGKQDFIQEAKRMDAALQETSGPFFLDNFSVVDCVFVPYVERMNASLFYYKGFVLRDKKAFPNIAAWFEGLESRETYRGTQSDFHTHCHDLPPQVVFGFFSNYHCVFFPYLLPAPLYLIDSALISHSPATSPPQMGGCYESGDSLQSECKQRVDSCVDFTIPESGVQEEGDSRYIALQKFLKHRASIMTVNPMSSDKNNLDLAMRTSLTWMMHDDQDAKADLKIPSGSEVGLRYIRDRINVPRDMPLWSARSAAAPRPTPSSTST